MIRSQYRVLQHKTLITLKEKKNCQTYFEGEKSLFSNTFCFEWTVPFQFWKIQYCLFRYKKQPYDFVKTRFGNISYNLLQLNSINSLQLIFFFFEANLSAKEGEK